MTNYKHVTQLAWPLLHLDALFHFEWFSDKLMPSLSSFTTLFESLYIYIQHSMVKHIHNIPILFLI